MPKPGCSAGEVRDGFRIGAASNKSGNLDLVSGLANRVLFDAMHIVGATVLIILGVQAWRSARHSNDEDAFASALT